MTYVLGIELAADAVRLASMSTPTELDEPIETHPPVLFCEPGVTWAGRDAIEQGAGRSQGFVEDVVDQFTVDRLFLTAGRLLTPDQALRELLWGVVCRPARIRQAWPDGVTISCPIAWNPAVRERVEAIVVGLQLQRPNVVVGFGADSAAADAYRRLPAATAAPALAPAVELPSLSSAYQPEVVAVVAPPAIVPREAKQGSPRLAVIASVCAVVALLVFLGAVVLRNHNGQSTRPPAPPSASTPPTR